MNKLIWKTDKEIAGDIAARSRKTRKRLGLTQKELAIRSGVSYGSVKRFEESGEISLSSLIKIAIALSCESDFESLFARKKYTSIEEVIDENNRKTGSKNRR